MQVGKYDGGKGNVFRQIINEMPPHKTFVAAFVGGGSVTLYKKQAKRNILIDLDPDVIETWYTHLVKNGVAEAPPFLTMGAAIVESDDAAASLNLAIPAHIVTCDDATWWELYTGDALPLLPLLGLDADTLIYADPPYLFDVRRGNGRLYEHEFGEEWEHEAMIDCFGDLDCMVMISGYWSGLYAGLMANGWRSYSFDAYDRGNNRREEFVWCNFPETTRLHDYKWLGDDFRERERIGRKADRWVNRFRKLPVLERRRILHELESAGVLD